MSKSTDGEVFALLTDNGRLAWPVKLDVCLAEADRVTTPYLRMNDNRLIDGIMLDTWGNPAQYTILDNHPGEGHQELFSTIDADSVIHWYRTDRPGQHRGIPEITPALPLFAQLRRFNILQDRITRSRMAGDPPDLLLSPRLSHIGLLEFHRVNDAVQEGRACVMRASEELQRLLGNNGLL